MPPMLEQAADPDRVRWAQLANRVGQAKSWKMGSQKRKLFLAGMRRPGYLRESRSPYKPSPLSIAAFHQIVSTSCAYSHHRGPLTDSRPEINRAGDAPIHFSRAAHRVVTTSINTLERTILSVFCQKMQTLQSGTWDRICWRRNPNLVLHAFADIVGGTVTPDQCPSRRCSVISDSTGTSLCPLPS